MDRKQEDQLNGNKLIKLCVYEYEIVVLSVEKPLWKRFVTLKSWIIYLTYNLCFKIGLAYRNMLYLDVVDTGFKLVYLDVMTWGFFPATSL